MKKITLMLLAMFAAVTVNAQTSPMMQSQFGNSKTVDELVGWFYWWNRTTSAEPQGDANATTEVFNDLYNADTNPEGKTKLNGRYVCFAKLDADSIMIYNMFEMPVKAKVAFKADGTGVAHIRIPINQVVAKDAELGDIYLWQTTWVTDKWVTYTDVRLYGNANSWYVSNNWIQMYSLDGEERVPYGNSYIPGFAYSYFRAVETLNNVDVYKASNAIMYVTFDKVTQTYPNTTYPVKVTQEGDVVKVENFNGGGTTVNIDLKSGNKLSIEHQTGMFGETEYTYYPAIGGGLVGPDMENIIEGTGTEDKLSWGDYCRHSDFATYQYATGEIVFMNPTTNKFTFPENDPTAIQDVETATDENAAALEYNLAGQRVGKDYKGIVVKNGKKMIKF